MKCDAFLCIAQQAVANLWGGFHPFGDIGTETIISAATPPPLPPPRLSEACTYPHKRTHSFILSLSDTHNLLLYLSLSQIHTHMHPHHTHTHTHTHTCKLPVWFRSILVVCVGAAGECCLADDYPYRMQESYTHTHTLTHTQSLSFWHLHTVINIAHTHTYILPYNKEKGLLL